jgi:hypothetical protein
MNQNINKLKEEHQIYQSNIEKYNYQNSINIKKYDKNYNDCNKVNNNDTLKN